MWFGVTAVIGLACLAWDAGPVGWLLFAAGAIWLWRRG